MNKTNKQNLQVELEGGFTGHSTPEKLLSTPFVVVRGQLEKTQEVELHEVVCERQKTVALVAHCRTQVVLKVIFWMVHPNVVRIVGFRRFTK